MIGVALRAYLLGQSEVTALVGDRIYPDRLPEHPTLPAVRYALVNDMRHTAYDGPLVLAPATVQIDVWALTRMEVWQVKDALNAALIGVAEPMGDHAKVWVPRGSNASDLYESETGRYRTMLRYELWYDTRVTV